MGRTSALRKEEFQPREPISELRLKPKFSEVDRIWNQLLRLGPGSSNEIYLLGAFRRAVKLERRRRKEIMKRNNKFPI